MNTDKSFTSPMSGELVSLEQIPDENFSDGSLGVGFGVKITGEAVVSPFDGVVLVALKAGHAFIVKREDGLEALIHIGLNSADKPQAFRAQVKKYQKVKQGEVLTYVDTAALGSTDKDLISPVVFSNPNVKIDFLGKKELSVGANEIKVSLS